jgi:site-specific DNA-methyltransferase (adenine-specific)/site-specific DNA-methyltransferase (cytosine-N4-specific)
LANKWPNRLNVPERPARDFLDNKKNWRIHPIAQRRGIVQILNTVGKVKPLLAYNSERYGGLTLYDGHLRKDIDPDEMWPVVIADLTDEEADFVIMTLDAVTPMVEIDYDILDSLVEDAGPLEEDIAAILATLDVELPETEQPPLPDPGPQVDRAEELQEAWRVEMGQVWQCGEHYVICGDCREPETWKKLLSAAGVEKVNGVFTSPPYAEQRKKQYGGVPVDQYVEWWDAVQQNVRDNLAEDGSFFVNIKPHCEDGQRALYVFDLVLAMVRRWGWRFVDELCWYRGGLPGDPAKWRHFKNEFEPLYHFANSDHFRFLPDNMLYKSSLVIGEVGRVEALDKIQGHGAGKCVTRDDGLAYPGNVIKIRAALQHDAPSHSAAFPVNLPDFFVRAYSDEGDVWCDQFLGSGTTIVAAHNNGRRGIGIERLEKYVAVCLQRFQDAFGVEPVLVG